MGKKKKEKNADPVVPDAATESDDAAPAKEKSPAKSGTDGGKAEDKPLEKGGVRVVILISMKIVAIQKHFTDLHRPH